MDGPDVPVPLLPGGEALLRAATLHPPQPGALGGPPAVVLRSAVASGAVFSAVKRSIGFTIGFQNHREGPY